MNAHDPITGRASRTHRRAAAFAALAVVLIAAIWLFTRPAETPVVLPLDPPDTREPLEREDQDLADAPLAEPPLSRDEERAATTDEERADATLEARRDGLFELRVVPSPAWIEEGAPAHLGPALVQFDATFDREGVRHLGTWRRDHWSFLFDDQLPASGALRLWTSGSPLIGTVVDVAATSDASPFVVDLATHGRAVRCVLVYGDELRLAVDDMHRTTGADVGLDLSSELCAWADLVQAGAVVATAPLERVAPERFGYGDAYEARFDAIPDGDYELRLVSGLQRGVSIDASRARVIVRGEDALVHTPLHIDFARIGGEVDVEVVVDQSGIVPERIDVVAFGAPVGASLRSAVTGRWVAPVVDGVARFTIGTRVAVPRRILIAAEGAKPVFIDGGAALVGGRLLASFEKGSGGVVIGGGTFGGSATAPIPGPMGRWHESDFALDAHGCAELTSDFVVGFDATTVRSFDLRAAKVGGYDGAPVRIDPSESGPVLFLEVIP